MPRNPIFDLFEVLCTELATSEETQVIDEAGISDEALIADLKKSFRETETSRAFERAVEAISAHFHEKRARLPFTYDLPTRRFTPTDRDYLAFIAFARAHRSVGGRESEEFEIQTLHRLRLRVTGDLHRVGVPRTLLRRKNQIIPYLRRLGFDANVLEKKDQDGGFDILWLPPLGTIPLRPVVSLQCKNGPFDEGEATKSAGRAQRSLSRHSHVRSCGFIKFVVFNDYIEPQSFIGRAAGWIFLPLGLTDLANASILDYQEIL
jgi:hypothetical protein